jgi:hypothetical protein
MLLSDPFIINSLGVGVLTDVVTDALEAIANGGLERTGDTDDEEDDSDAESVANRQHNATTRKHISVRQHNNNINIADDDDPDKTMKMRRSVMPRRDRPPHNEIASEHTDDDYESSFASMTIRPPAKDPGVFSDSEASSRHGDDEYGDDSHTFSDDNSEPSDSSAYQTNKCRFINLSYEYLHLF